MNRTIRIDAPLVSVRPLPGPCMVLDELARVPARRVPGSGDLRVEWHASDGRFLQASRLGESWVIWMEGDKATKRSGDRILPENVYGIARRIVQEHAFECEGQGVLGL